MSWRWFIVMCVASGLVVLGVGFGCSTTKPGAASGSTSGPGGILTGPCSPEGATHVCSTDLGVQHGVHDCFAGQQTCTNGAWGPCTGSRTLNASMTGVKASQPQIRTLATPTADAAGCVSNFCDPSCMGFDEDAGNTCTTTTTYAGSIAASGIPNAQMLALQLDETNYGPGSWNNECDRFPNLGGGSYSYFHDNQFMACQLDSYCNNPTDFCNAFLPGQSWPSGYCTGPDLTIGVTCSQAGEINVPVCNRGSAPVAAGTVIDVTQWGSPASFPIQFDLPKSGGSVSTCTPPTIGMGSSTIATGTCVATAGGCPSNASLTTLTGAGPTATCSVTLGAALAPGDCVDLVNTTDCGGGLTANGFLWVNASGAVAECDLQRPDEAPITWPGCSNNLGYAEVTSPPTCVPIVQIGGSCLSGGGILAGGGGYGALPGGWRKNEGPCHVNHRAAPAGPNNETDCSYDTCCAADNTNCTPWPGAPSTGACTLCSGVDYTVGIGCSDGSGDFHFPVCNRGSGTANSGSLRLGIDSSPPGGEHACNNQSNSGKGLCTIDLSVNPIASNSCIDVNINTPTAGITCSGVSLGGNRSAYINEGSSPLGECDPCNNWSASTGQSCSGYGGLPPPATQEFTYTAVCPPQTRPQWKELAYVVNTPPVSDVLFAIQVSDIDDGGIAGTPQPAIPIPVADPPLSTPPPATGANPWPQTCGFAPSAPCPVDLFAALNAAGGPALTSLPVLTLSITLTSTSAPAIANSWDITYDCVPSE